MGRERETGPQAGQAEDPELLRRCREGDISALAELYDRYVDLAYRHALYFTRDDAAASELTVRAFLQVWQGARRGRRGPFVPWLLETVHRLAAARMEQDPKVSGDAASGTGRQGDVLRAILRLRSAERLVLSLRFIDGLGYEEIGALLGRDVPSVLRLQYRALSRLRGLLAVGRDAQADSGL